MSAARAPKRPALAALLAVAAALAAACALEFKGVQRPYGLGARTRALLGDDEAAEAALLRELERLFGTPDAPAFAPPGEELNRRATAAELVRTGEARPVEGAPAPSLAASAGVYAARCLHCHGNEGGGDGPTAATARPRPRDFRHGLFKYDDLKDGARPELSDLVAVITRGIGGTAMPSSRVLTDPELHGLAEYVRLLAMRGETERLLAAEYEPARGITPELADEAYREVLALWLEAERVRFTPPEPAPPATGTSVRRGHELFHERARCASCHGNGGRGRGPAAWGPLPEDPGSEGWLLRDAWGEVANPRDLVDGPLLHGEEPGEVLTRIHLGIDGTPMAGIGDTLGPDGLPLFGEEDLWSLVHYILALRDDRWSELLAELHRQP
jgi:mono/diheme cytochrome c family protein